jgi:hypothetical protein
VPPTAAGRPRILAWTEGRNAYVIGTPAALSLGGAEGWEHVGWHEIERGGWNAETGTLSWVRYDGRRGSVALTDPARLPELFRERVAASIVVERFVSVRGERGLVVNGRRDLSAARDGPPPISWHATLGRGLTWSTPGVREAADRAIAELRAEWDPGGSGW